MSRHVRLYVCLSVCCMTFDSTQGRSPWWVLLDGAGLWLSQWTLDLLLLRRNPLWFQPLGKAAHQDDFFKALFCSLPSLPSLYPQSDFSRSCTQIFVFSNSRVPSVCLSFSHPTHSWLCFRITYHMHGSGTQVFCMMHQWSYLSQQRPGFPLTSLLAS